MRNSYITALLLSNMKLTPKIEREREEINDVLVLIQLLWNYDRYLLERNFVKYPKSRHLYYFMVFFIDFFIHGFAY